VYVAQLPPNGNASDPLAFTNVSARQSTVSAVSSACCIFVPPSFVQVEVGHEEVCMNVIRAPALGSVLSGAAGKSLTKRG
jgi:hypothetical protein